MGWIGNAFQSWAVKTQIKEASDFVRRLSAMDGIEMGTLVAISTDYRNAVRRLEGIDLMRPFEALQHDPQLALRLNKLIRDLQTHGTPFAAAGVMVWLHTLRGAVSLDVRQLSRDMWGELERGFPHALDACWPLYELSGQKMTMDRYDEFPEGFTPKPL